MGLPCNYPYGEGYQDVGKQDVNPDPTWGGGNFKFKCVEN